MKLPRGIHKRGDRYYIQYFHDGRRYRESAGRTLTAAKRLLAKRKNEIDEGRLGIVKVPKVRFEEAVERFLEYCRQNLKHPDRPAITINHAAKLFTGKYMKNITNWDIEMYKSMRRNDRWNGRPISPTTIKKELGHLNRLFVLAGEWDMVPENHNPVKKVKKPKEDKGRLPELSLEQEARLLDALPSNVLPIVKFAIYTGCRRGEILGLTWEQVNLEEGFIFLDKTKTDNPRAVPLCDTALDILRSLERCNEHVFLSRRGKPYRCIRASFNRAKSKADLDYLTFHDLRHVFASRLRRLGASLGDISEALGHKSTRMTLRYAHLTPDYMKDLVQLLNQTATKTATPGKGVAEVVPLSY